MSLIITAARFADYCHKGETRRGNGEPFVMHPARVAARVAMHPAATEVWVAAAWLHDTGEPPVSKLALVQNLFPAEVYTLVKELTNDTHNPNLPRAARKKRDRLRIMDMSCAAKIIKLLDRIDNVLSLWGEETDFNETYCQESALLLDVLKGADDVLWEELRKLVA